MAQLQVLMPGSEIKSGSEVIGDFLASKKDDKKIDKETLAIVQDLFVTKKLTKGQLLRSLEKDRESGGSK